MEKSSFSVQVREMEFIDYWKYEKKKKNPHVYIAVYSSSPQSFLAPKTSAPYVNLMPDDLR